MRDNLAITGEAILAERASLSGAAGEPGDYLGLSSAIVDDILGRTRE
jgi:hypothetical protein